MLQTLPAEILCAITVKLNFSDKLNLCKTCCKLYEQISKTNLYATLVAFKNPEDVIRMFQDKTLDGTHVQVLDVSMDRLSDKIYSNLADIFPNVTRVKTDGNFIEYYERERKKREDHIIRPLLKWKDTIKQYDSTHDWIYFRNELFFSIFPRLEELTLWQSYSIPGRKEGFDTLFLSRAIKNAPMLTQLSLTMCDISIDSLEEIHNGCSYIRSLRFNDVMLIVDNNRLPQLITPAYSVLSLEICVTSFDKYGLYLDYIIYKYPNLQYLNIYMYNYDVFFAQQNLLSYYPSYNRILIGGSIEHDRICENRLNELEPTTDAYKSNSSSFLLRLPKSIKKLALSSDVFETAIETISKMNLDLSVLELYNVEELDTFIKSGQLGYVRNINSLRSLNIYLESSVQSLELDFISLTVTSLDIKLMDRGFCISWIFAMFPSLESLKVKSKEYLLIENEVIKVVRVGKTYPRLRKLDFGNCNVHPESLNYIKTALPNVREVIWNAYIEFDSSYRRHYTVDFTGWNLDKLDFTMESRNHKLEYYYTVFSTQKETLRFLQKIYTDDTLPVEGEPNSVEGAAKVNIICNRVKCFSVNRRRVYS